MSSLRIEADTATQKAEELQARVKTLEQENLAKEQEITSLSHKNGVLEAEVEKLENQIKEIKGTAEESTQHSRQNETLQRRLQLLEEEAEEADKNLRETNDKYVISVSAMADCLIPQARAYSDTKKQVAPDRRQGRALRAQGQGFGAGARFLGVQVRGDVQEVRRCPEGARGLPARDRQHLSGGRLIPLWFCLCPGMALELRSLGRAPTYKRPLHYLPPACFALFSRDTE